MENEHFTTRQSSALGWSDNNEAGSMIVKWTEDHAHQEVMRWNSSADKEVTATSFKGSQLDSHGLFVFGESLTFIVSKFSNYNIVSLFQRRLFHLEPLEHARYSCGCGWRSYSYLSSVDAFCDGPGGRDVVNDPFC